MNNSIPHIILLIFLGICGFILGIFIAIISLNKDNSDSYFKVIEYNQNGQVLQEILTLNYEVYHNLIIVKEINTNSTYILKGSTKITKITEIPNSTLK